MSVFITGLLGDTYFQAALAFGVTWYSTSTYRPAVMYNESGTLANEYFTPETAAAAAAALVLAWHNGLIPMGRSDTISDMAFDASAMTLNDVLPPESF